MEILNYDFSEYKIYNPVRGDVIVDPECDDDAPSLHAYWFTEMITEPMIKDPGLSEAWESFIKKAEEEDENFMLWSDDLVKFLEGYDNPAWKVLEVTSSGIACGPVSSTIWFVVDKETEIEEVEGEEYDPEADDYE
ncbi:MAG TPA: hypothetical protein PLV06_06075 [Bacteroidales bacterium]|nr:hypothetical protein [Bacteroidales bacterium]HPF02255.1 hypothetical protein [Bacteroidales bacterium]HPJ58785.1 hypothetical protein [Bacteroidales bacterium]HPR11935.1 hypothetical protein [Bacteroidales bacterium]HRW85366.1 hypothetical protein [Bacteroidales bacterium]